MCHHSSYTEKCAALLKQTFNLWVYKDGRIRYLQQGIQYAGKITVSPLNKQIE